MKYEVILQRMLSNAPSDVDKREGSIIYDALAPAALELAQLYAELDTVMDETFADTAGRESLIKRAGERGIVPFPATVVIVKGEFNVPVSENTRFSLGETRYSVAEALPEGGYRLICEDLGSVGNKTGTLTPIDYVDGLISAEVVSIITQGEDEEDTERLRKRYFDSLDVQSFGGNISDYRRNVLSVSGVGGVKVEPVWQGGGTVRLIVQDSQYGVPGAALINEVEDAINDLAPIGHSVTVTGVVGFTVNVSAQFVTASGWSFNDVLPYLESVADNYFKEINEGWDKSEQLILRSSQLEARLLSVSGIVDIFNLKLNNSAGNITLNENSVLVRGVVTNVN
ncbi:MAG: baseplate J/gp47 family protein [Oscillospiraceae bacterium]|nr:baseplate J/gp47 family protein [Oscillospiraceae bacterium]